MSRKGAPFLCTYENCTASFSRPDRLKNHFRTHTGECLFVCEYEECNNSYPSAAALKRHEATHEDTFKCTIEGCFEILKTKQTLKKHVDNFHLKKKPKLYKCTECDKDFNKHNWLQRHMYRHTGVYPYKCHIEGCEKGFLLPSKLKTHMKTHEGHSCKIPGCEKVFLKWSLYVAHLKEYHPAVHKCHSCEKEFSTSSNLKAHSAVHELTRKVFPCEMPNCTRFYFAEKNLKWHVRSYHDARPYVCDKENCHRAFKTKDALDHHVSRHTRRKPRKKKKPRPSFSAILSGCADPRKFTRKMPPKQVVSESSDEFTTDEEVPYQDTSEEENTPKKSHSEATDSHKQSPEDKAGPSHSVDSQFSRIPPRKHVEPDSTDMDSSYEEPFSKNTAAYSRDHLTTLIETESLNQRSTRKSPRKCIRLETCESLGGYDPQGDSMPEGHAAIGNDDIESGQSRTGWKSTEKDASSSEYETLTVSVFGSVGDKCFSGSDEVSSCLSEAEDMLSCNEMCSRGEG